MTADALFHFLVTSWLAPLSLTVPVARAYENAPADAAHYLVLDTYSTWTQFGMAERQFIEGEWYYITQHECAVGVWEVGESNGDETVASHSCGAIVDRLLASIEFQAVREAFKAQGLAVRKGDDPQLMPDLNGQEFTLQYRGQILVGLARIEKDPGLVPVESVQYDLQLDSHTLTGEVP